MTNQNYCHLSVDLEDYKDATMRDVGVPPRVSLESTRRGVETILSVLERVPGSRRLTFFTTGQVARGQSDLVRSLSDGGHEIACHGDLHENVWDLDQSRFEKIVQRAVKSLEDVSGRRISGFRAPNFSFDDRCPWMHQILGEAGFSYDSSLVQSKSREREAIYDVVRLPEGAIFEIPIYQHPVAFGLGVRVIGGTYFRLLPVRVILNLFRKSDAMGYAPIIYLHPADLDRRFAPVQMREMEGLPIFSRLKWRIRQAQWSLGTRWAAEKLAAVLREFPNKGPLNGVLPG